MIQQRVKTILIMTPSPNLVEQVEVALADDGVELVHRVGLEGSEPLLKHGLVDGCIVDVDGVDESGAWSVERVIRAAGRTPVFVVAGRDRWEREEEAYFRGVAHVFNRPVRDALLRAVINRSIGAAAIPPEPERDDFSDSLVPAKKSATYQPERELERQRGLDVVRDFSSVLAHSRNAESLVERFLFFFRELFGINRAAVFLMSPSSALDSSPARIGDSSDELDSICAIGLGSNVLEHVKLSLRGGIGGFLHRHGCALRRDAEAVAGNREMRTEFELLGGEVAVPILDRERLIGVAVFGPRVTGNRLLDAEVELTFHLLEDLGLAIKNHWLHDRVASNHALLAGILEKLTSACIVVGDDLKVLHVNRMALRYFGQRGRGNDRFDFSDLPEAVGTKIYQTLLNGAAIEPFEFKPDGASGKVYQLTIIPFQVSDSGKPQSVMALAEDRTQSEQLKRLEIETSSLRLVKGMSERLAHEIGNAIVPLSTHEQLFAQKYEDDEFRDSLSTTLTDGVRRISRLAKQMFFLARERFEIAETAPVKKLVEDAFASAQEFYNGQSATLKFVDPDTSLSVLCDYAGLRYALSEVLLNAMQAHSNESQVIVDAGVTTGSDGKSLLRMKVGDTGEGFSDESAKHALEPFFTTRSVGIGLGLTVANKIIDRHHGRICIASNASEGAQEVVIELPA